MGDMALTVIVLLRVAVGPITIVGNDFYNKYSTAAPPTTMVYMP